MLVHELHYDFKQKINRLDSQQYRNLRAPEIDWLLNEAQLFIIKTVLHPKMRPMLELNNRTIDDVKNLIVRNFESVSHVRGNRYEVLLGNLNPKYLYFINATAYMKKECCDRSIPAQVFLMQHAGLFENNDFYRSSFDWREVASVMEEGNRMILFDDGDSIDRGTFDITEVAIDYIKYPKPIFYGGYHSADGLLTPSDAPQSSELSEHMHRDIVDIAVMIAAGNLQLSDFQIKMNKVQLNNQ